MKETTYSLKDISMIIATYNRSDDLKISLDVIKKFIPKLNEVIIIDQSKTSKTKDFIKHLHNKKIKYIHTSFPSLARARNLGVKNLSKDSKIVWFIDDDATLPHNYFDAILNIYNKYYNAKGVSAYIKQKSVHSKFESFLRRIFFLEHQSKNKMKVMSVYGCVYPSALTKVIVAEWLSGVNMSFKREIFDDGMEFDNNLIGYSLGEDFDFSYRVHKKYNNSLYITPEANVIHRVTPIERFK